MSTVPSSSLTEEPNQSEKSYSPALNPEDSEEELNASEQLNDSLEVIGEGSFSRVYGHTHSPWGGQVYKVCKNPDDVRRLLHESKLYDELRMFIIDRNGADFLCPFFRVLLKPPIDQQPHEGTDPKPDVDNHIFPYPTIQLDRIPALTFALEPLYKRLFVSEGAQSRVPRIHLLRLCLGCDLPMQITDFPQGFTSDLSVDYSRYTKLEEIFVGLPPIGHIAHGMGTLLASMHWGVGIDALNVKLVLGSRIIQNQFFWQCWVLNLDQVNGSDGGTADLQCERWLVYRPLEYLRFDKLTDGAYRDEDLVSGAMRLAHVISGQDYYPNPHYPELYEQFKTAYMAQVGVLINGVNNTSAGPDLFLSENRAGATKWVPKIYEAAGAFIKELDSLNTEKRRRRDERAQEERAARVGEQWRRAGQE
ncbi:hypothetical protein CspeluHIS016_0211130 [Cutaneotrichosporon spelunceum]|uniref:DUF3669 domain-containing protein n=1 Tax=Cutaneotrichosporon spelunceum TaxID=1672016 RepID=A0AAD3TSJ1_9TREE|nr:hypothetical protein CspeluHIS016_0211130 [Cutaneotrichosporon spelunceum]